MAEAKTKRKARKFIRDAVKHPGALRRKAEAAGETTREFADEHKHDSGTTGNEARLAETLMRMNRSRSRKRYAAKSVRKG